MPIWSVSAYRTRTSVEDHSGGAVEGSAEPEDILEQLRLQPFYLDLGVAGGVLGTGGGAAGGGFTPLGADKPEPD